MSNLLLSFVIFLKPISHSTGVRDVTESISISTEDKGSNVVFMRGEADDDSAHSFRGFIFRIDFSLGGAPFLRVKVRYLGDLVKPEPKSGSSSTSRNYFCNLLG